MQESIHSVFVSFIYSGMLKHLSKNLSSVRDTVNSSGALSDENAERMKTALTNFKENSAYGKHQ